MNSVLVTMAPAIDAFTSMYWPARSAASAMTSSVRLPSVAFRRPPTLSPVFAATDSVARLSRPASGTMASTESTNSSVADSGTSASAANTTGTKTSSHRSGFCRISCRIGVPVAVCAARFVIVPPGTVIYVEVDVFVGKPLVGVVSKIRLTAAKKNPVDQPHIRMPVNASMLPTSRQSTGSTRSP